MRRGFRKSLSAKKKKENAERKKISRYGTTLYIQKAPYRRGLRCTAGGKDRVWNKETRVSRIRFQYCYGLLISSYTRSGIASLVRVRGRRTNVVFAQCTRAPLFHSSYTRYNPFRTCRLKSSEKKTRKILITLRG